MPELKLSDIRARIEEIGISELLENANIARATLTLAKLKLEREALLAEGLRLAKEEAGNQDDSQKSGESHAGA